MSGGVVARRPEHTCTGWVDGGGAQRHPLHQRKPEPKPHFSHSTPSHLHTSTEGLMVEDPRATTERTSGWIVDTSPPCLVSIQERLTSSLSRACTCASSAQCWQNAASTCTLKEGFCTHCWGLGFLAAPGDSVCIWGSVGQGVNNSWPVLQGLQSHSTWSSFKNPPGQTL